MAKEVIELKKRIGSRVRELRDRNDISREALAERLEVSDGAIYQLEAGINWISPEFMLKLCDYFQCDPANLFADAPKRLEPTVQEAVEVVLRELDFTPVTLRRTQKGMAAPKGSKSKPGPSVPGPLLDALATANKDQVDSIAMILGIRNKKSLGLTRNKA